jgi:hypothetical protein
MKVRLATVIAAGAVALAPLHALSQTPTQPGTATSHPDMQKSGKIKKQTNPRKNGVSESESPNGANGQPQH